MPVFYTARRGLFKSGVKTLQNGMNKAMDKDTICINQSKLKLDDTVQLKNGVTIMGNPNKKRPVITADFRNVLLFIPANVSGSITIKHVDIVLHNQNIGIRCNSNNMNLILEDVHIYHDYSTVAPYNALLFDGHTNGSLTLTNTVLDSMQAEINSLNMEKSNIGDWFMGDNSQIFVNQLTMNDSALQNILVKGNDDTSQLQIRNTRVGGNVRFEQIDGSLVQLQLSQLPTINHEAKNAMTKGDSTSLIVGTKAKLAIKHLSQVDTNQEAFNTKWKLPKWRGLGVDGGSLTISDGYLVNGSLKNMAISGDITFENVTDDSIWQVSNKMHLSNRNSQSDLFAAQSKLNVSAQGANNIPKHTKSALQELDQMIGLTNVKARVQQIIAQAKANAERQKRGLANSHNQLSLNLVFAGSPGTGKTVVARLVGQALYEAGVLKSTKFVEARQADLVGEHVGETAPKTKEKIRSALDGVLFIDEAYELAPPKNGGNTFNDEAVTELVADMENYSNRLVVIMAGYTQNMSDFFRRGNPGLRSRINNWIEFPDYSPLELKKIGILDLEKSHARVANKETMMAISKGIDDLLPVISRGNDTGNGRFVRNYIQKLTEMRDARLNTKDISKLTNEQLMIIEPQDVTNTVKAMKKQAMDMQQ